MLFLVIGMCSLGIAAPLDMATPPAVVDPGYPDYPTGIPHRRDGDDHPFLALASAAAGGWAIGSVVGATAPQELESIAGL